MDEAAQKRATATKGGDGNQAKTLVILLFVARVEATAVLGHS